MVGGCAKVEFWLVVDYAIRLLWWCESVDMEIAYTSVL